MYRYAMIDSTGKCYEIRDTTNSRRDPYYVPIGDSNLYLSKYYWPILEFSDYDTDFNGEWYLDAAHTIKEVIT